MFSTQTVKYFSFLVAVATSIAACGDTVTTPQGPAPTASATATAPQKRTMNVTMNLGFDKSTAFAFALDFSSNKSTVEGRLVSPGRPNAPVVLPTDFLDAFAGYCSTQDSNKYVAAFASAYKPLDSAQISKVRVDVEANGGPPKGDIELCYAIHTKAGGWARGAANARIVVDSTGPSGGLEPPGKGHFDLPIGAADVDMLLLVSDSASLCILKTLSYDAIPSVAP
jgi:hypothetical protein